MKKVVNILLLITWIAIIFILSNQSGDASKEQSNIIVRVLSNIINIDKDTLTLIVRKLAHIFEYFVLYLLAYNCFKDYKKKYLIPVCIIFCILCSVTDEFHQLFISGREGKITDVFVDSIGILIGFILIEVAYGKKEKTKKISSTKA